MKIGKLGPNLIIGLIIALFFGMALFLRVYFPYDKIFTAEGIKFNGTDAYYFMRQVDNLLHNFPHHTSIDPYFLYPGGAVGEVSIRFFGWLIATITWVIGLGAPTGHIIDAVGVYFPAVLGALTVIPVYFIGKELFGRWAGVFAAGLITVLPGEFLGRSVLGYTDQHVAETLFTAVTMLFLILAIKAANQRQLTFSHLKRRDWVTMTKPALYSLLAGIFLGIYIFTWQGALLFVFIIAVYLVLQFIIDHLKGRSSDYLSFVGIITFLVALVISWLVAAGTFYLASEVIVLLSLLVLSGVAHLMVHQKIKSAYYPLVLLGLGLAGLGIFYLISPSFLVSMLGLFAVLIPRGAQLTTMEMQPILFPGGNFSLGVAWGNFPGLLPLDPATTGLTFGNILSFLTTSLFLSFIALGILIYFVIKQGSTEKSLLVVWSLIILAATLGQRRFAYYFAVNAALLTGYLSWRVLGLFGINEASTGAVTTQGEKSSKKARPRKGSSSVATTYAVKALAVIIIFFVVFSPNVTPAIDTARRVPFAPSDAWVSSLSWLKENTPDPFGNPDYYYELQKPPPAGENYTYPESAYGVMAWWDYGYWITRIAHRLPNANPSQDPERLTKVASFFTSQDESSADEIARKLDSAYIIVDSDIATGKFYAMVRWAGKGQSEFFDVYWVQQQNQIVPIQLYYPDYYRSLSIRLYNFDAKAVTPASTLVISYENKADEKGVPYKIVTGAQQFANYEEAEAYLLKQETDNYKIVGTNPFVSPVPLAALTHYRLIHSSDGSITVPEVGSVSEVKIFERYEAILPLPIN